MSESKFIPAYIEEFHGLILEKFHEFRLSKVDRDQTDVSIHGIEFNDIITSAKIELYNKRLDARNAGFKELPNDSSNRKS